MQSYSDRNDSRFSTRLEAGKWSQGRPVFKKVDGELRFLFVGDGTTHWIIGSSITATGGFIYSGKATNSPTSPEAGPSNRLGWTNWVFADDGGNLVEGDISVTCP